MQKLILILLVLLALTINNSSNAQSSNVVTVCSAPTSSESDVDFFLYVKHIENQDYAIQILAKDKAGHKVIYWSQIAVLHRDPFDNQFVTYYVEGTFAYLNRKDMSFTIDKEFKGLPNYFVNCSLSN